MTVKNLVNEGAFEVLNEGDVEKEISTPFCCDLLSIAMSKAPAECAWVTVMANVNTLAVATLTDTACIILAEGIQMDEATLKKAQEENVTVFATDQPIFAASTAIVEMMESYE